MRFEAAPDGEKRLHRFGLAIRAQRERMGLTLADMAAAYGYSTSTWSRYENGSPIPPELPAKLDELMGTHGMFAVLWDMIKNERWPNRYRDYMRLEDGAREIAEYAPYVVPGLLQTPEYARALFQAVNPDATADTIESMVDLRMSRQARLRSSDPPYVSAVLDETVIRRAVGGSAVLCAQLEALLPLVDTSRTLLRVAPLARGAHAALGAPLIILGLPDGGQVAYLEGLVNGQLLEDPDTVRARRRSYDRVSAEALTPGESAALITAVIKEKQS
ncbi:helix-turn-helix domain-containing protein [Embleya scabrispora]|uniref:helix-turn-helix domain-containing protein n=1 Tax=Embleya scabrispora TaxID=159449 RepID=UPI00117EEE1E|nr:helix-turn-helix transcriptional regulator [Embleya scabrispora]